jgi:hypothetical protein
LTPQPRRRCGTGTSRKRHDHSRRPSSNTAIDGFAPGAERTLRHQPEDGRQVAEACELEDRPMGPKVPRSTVLSPDEETLIVAFRRHTWLPLDDCLYALQATIPHLTRSSLHRLFQRHGINHLPSVEGPLPRRQFRAYALGYVHIDLAEVWTEERSCICSSRSTGSASSPSRNSTNRPRAGPRRTSFDGLWNACPTAFTQSSLTTGFSSRRPKAAGGSKRSNDYSRIGSPSVLTPLI